VDRRQETRLAENQPATIAVLGDRLPASIRGRVIEIAASSMKISVPVAIAPGTPVRVECYDALFLGEICRADHCPAEIRIVVKIVHSLSSLAELERMNRALLGPASAPETVPRY